MPAGLRHDRRDFLRTSAAAAAATALPVSTLAAAAKPLPASERVNVAMVGIGGKGINNRLMLQGTGMCNIVALCDVHYDGPRTLYTRVANGDAPLPDGVDPAKCGEIDPKAARFSDFRVMFDKMGDQIDAVCVSTPDHTHFPIAMLAMSLGKHVWVEKPLAHTFGQCRRLMDLARRSGVATQMGNQGHSSANRTQFEAWTKAGVIKDVTRIVCHMNKGRRWHGWGANVQEYPRQPLPDGMDWETWTGPATMNPYSKRLHPGNWRSWFDYGSGALGDWGPHILDTCHRFLRLGLPESVTAVKREGANPLVYPQASTLRFAFPQREAMPACEVLWYDGRKNTPDLGPGFSPLEPSRPGKAIYAGDRRFEGYSHSSQLSIVAGPPPAQSMPEYERRTPNHWQNFLMACRGEAECNSPLSIGGPLTQVLNLGMIAQRLGGTLRFDRDTEQFVSNDQANALLDPEPRQGWEEYYRL